MEWPTEIVEHLGREPEIGDWYAECCEADLFIVTQLHEMDEIRENQYDGWTGGRFWPSKISALRELQLTNDPLNG